jgi:uncharacterized membrane protein YczE
MRLPIMTTGRWMICIAFCAIVLAAWMAFHRWVAARLAPSIQEAREQAGLLPGAPMEGVGIRVPNDMMTWIELDALFIRFSFVLWPVIFLIGFGIAWSIPSNKGVTRAPSAPAEKP